MKCAKCKKSISETDEFITNPSEEGIAEEGSSYHVACYGPSQFVELN